MHNFILLHAENSPHEKNFPTYKKILTKKLPKQTKTMYGPTQIQKTPTQNLIVVLYYKKSFFFKFKIQIKPYASYYTDEDERRNSF